MQRFKTSLLLILVTGILVACSTPRGNLTTLSGIQNYNPPQGTIVGRATTDHIRNMAIEETALSIGAQGGLAARAREINHNLVRYEDYLNQIFNFHALLLDHNILPPVLVEGRNTINLDDPNTLRITDRTYHIIRQARFVTGTPSWHDYLKMHYVPPEPVHPSMTPKNQKERRAWSKFVKQGWDQGTHQAELIFRENLARLRRDFKGMIRYRILLAKHMVTPPYVAGTEFGITGDRDHMHIHDRVLRISALPQMQLNSRIWRPGLSHKKEDEGILRWQLMNGGKLPMKHSQIVRIQPTAIERTQSKS